jgi:hypothetical protein
MISKLNQNILFICTSVLLVCMLLICQPLIETCLKLDDSISLIESDVDIENELEENSFQEFDKLLSFKVMFSIESIVGEDALNNSNSYIKNYWLSQFQDIFIPPPKLMS